MNRPSFDQTVSVLVKAYLKGTLEHGNYCGCAVGNILAASVGAKIVIGDRKKISKYKWDHPVYHGSEWYCSTAQDQEALSLISKSGYTFLEIWQIEKAFEGARLSDRYDNEDDQFRGLMAVVDVLASIHNVDLSTKEQAKLLFMK